MIPESISNEVKHSYYKNLQNKSKKNSAIEFSSNLLLEKELISTGNRITKLVENSEDVSVTTTRQIIEIAPKYFQKLNVLNNHIGGWMSLSINTLNNIQSVVRILSKYGLYNDLWFYRDKAYFHPHIKKLITKLSGKVLQRGLLDWFALQGFPSVPTINSENILLKKVNWNWVHPKSRLDCIKLLELYYINPKIMATGWFRSNPGAKTLISLFSRVTKETHPELYESGVIALVKRKYRLGRSKALYILPIPKTEIEGINALLKTRFTEKFLASRAVKRKDYYSRIYEFLCKNDIGEIDGNPLPLTNYKMRISVADKAIINQKLIETIFSGGWVIDSFNNFETFYKSFENALNKYGVTPLSGYVNLRNDIVGQVAEKLTGKSFNGVFSYSRAKKEFFRDYYKRREVIGKPFEPMTKEHLEREGISDPIIWVLRAVISRKNVREAALNKGLPLRQYDYTDKENRNYIKSSVINQARGPTSAATSRNWTLISSDIGAIELHGIAQHFIEHYLIKIMKCNKGIPSPNPHKHIHDLLKGENSHLSPLTIFNLELYTKSYIKYLLSNPNYTCKNGKLWINSLEKEGIDAHLVWEYSNSYLKGKSRFAELIAGAYNKFRLMKKGIIERKSNMKILRDIIDEMCYYSSVDFDTVQFGENLFKKLDFSPNLSNGDFLLRGVVLSIACDLGLLFTI